MAFVLSTDARDKLNAVPMNDRHSVLTLKTPAPVAPKPTAPTPERKLG